MCVCIPSGNQTWLAGLSEGIFYVCMYTYAHTGTIWGMSAELGCPVLGLLRSQSASECPSQMANGQTRHAHLCSSITVNPMFDDSINCI